MPDTISYVVATLFLFGSTTLHPLYAQINTGGAPPSTQHDAVAPTPSSTYKLPPFTRPAKQISSPAGTTAAPRLLPFQYGTPRPVDIDLKQAAGQHELSDGQHVWRLRIVSSGARALRLIYDDFRVPPSAKLYIYNDERQVVRGAFTNRNNKPYGGFATDVTPGEVVILEYTEPPDPAFSGRIHISSVVHAWRSPNRTVAAKNATAAYEPTSLPCSINTACSPSWSAEAQATVLIDRGGATCSGVLLNNTQGDRTPYVLTANHCGHPSEGETVNWIFKFNYASSSCTDPAQTPSYQSITGAVVRAAESGNQEDFTLLELSEPIPASYNPYFAGWSIEAVTPSQGVAIGHPQGDIRKITFDNDAPLNYSTRWIADFDQGVIEGGSSGSPLFNENHQVIGQLRGALSVDFNVCSGPGGDDNDATITFPKLSHNWNQGAPGQRLSDFLDPNDSGATSVSGLEGPSNPPINAWISEIDGNTNPDGASEDDAEFIEVAGPAGANLANYEVAIYTCSNGTTSLQSTETVQSNFNGNGTFPDDSDGTGFFVLGGPTLDGSTPDQTFSGSGVDAIPDGRGIIVLRDPQGQEVFDYQYDATSGGAPVDCPSNRVTRSIGDDYTYGSGAAPSGKSSDESTSMGFSDASPSDESSGSSGFSPSPGASNATPIPVELTAFNAIRDGGAVVLRWTTASETHNAGFEVQKRKEQASERPGGWEKIAFVEGAGTTIQPQTYRYPISSLPTGTYQFRLKQVDVEGAFEYSPAIRVDVVPAAPYHLSAVHPNPVHQRAAFTLAVAQPQRVRVAMYDLLGRRVALLHDGVLPAHSNRRFTVRTRPLPSGVYLLRIAGERFATTQKVTVIR